MKQDRRWIEGIAIVSVSLVISLDVIVNHSKPPSELIIALCLVFSPSIVNIFKK